MAGCVPDLQFDVGLFFNNHTEVAEFDTDCHAVLLFKSMVSQSLQDAGLANSCVAQNNDLKNDIKVIENALKVRVVLDRNAGRQVLDLRMQ